MSRLRVFADHDPQTVLAEHSDPGAIGTALAGAGIGYQRWPVRALASYDSAEILAAYTPEIETLKATGGYRAVDVVALHPAHPDRAVLRQKFLAEHTHSEDEVRFFVAGRGLFTMHIGDHVYELTATAGDLVTVPAGTKHWFDTGEEPSFTAVRLFLDPSGWVAQYTGSEIALGFPRLAS